MREKNICFEICTTCSLNCKACSFSIPTFKSNGINYYVSLDTFQRELEEIFNIYDHVEGISLVGGEPLLHNQIDKLVAYALRTYSSKFNQLRIITNGTLLPNDSLISALKSYGKGNVEIQISDYGPLSNKVEDIGSLLQKNSIPYRIKEYYDSKQYCGGWVDYGPLDCLRGYSEEKMQSVLKHCRMSYDRYLSVLNGKLTICCHAAAGFHMNCFDLNPGEYVDLFDATVSLEKKRRIISEFGTKPTQACYHCNGFDPQNSPRIPGAEQI